MNSKTVTTNVNIEIPEGLNQSPTKREMVSSARRPPSSRRPPQPPPTQPIKHEPCSSTLGKFHDSVNFSLVLDTTRSRAHHPPPIESPHPLIEAKNKYKYMVRQKSYVDESLFGNTSARSLTNRRGSFGNGGNVPSPKLNQYLNNHLTHDLMSNLAPLIVNPPIRSQLNSARSVTSEINKIDSTTSTKNDLTSRKPIKPWKP